MAPLRQATVADGLIAGSVAAVLSAAPSTTHAALTGGDPLKASRAIGAIALRGERRTGPLLLAATPIHVSLSLAWGMALSATLPRRHTIGFGALAGLAIAAFDLGLIGRRIEPIRALPQGPQVADHIAYGAVAAAVLQTRRSGRASAV